MKNKTPLTVKVRIGDVISSNNLKGEKFNSKEIFMLEGFTTEDLMKELDQKLKEKNAPSLADESRITLYNKFKEIEEYYNE